MCYAFVKQRMSVARVAHKKHFLVAIAIEHKPASLGPKVVHSLEHCHLAKCVEPVGYIHHHESFVIIELW